MNFDAKVQRIFPDSKFSQGRKEGRKRDRKGALDIFRGIIVRGKQIHRSSEGGDKPHPALGKCTIDAWICTL